jgi:hypothetical protein
MKKIALFFLTVAMACTMCTAPAMRQFYPDTYFEADNVYENKTLRFILTYGNNWYLFTDPNEMDKQTRAFAKSLQKQGVELLFAGATVDGMHGTRGIAVNLNESGKEYAQRIYDLNKDDVVSDEGLIDFIIKGKNLVKWTYAKSGFRFVEFFFAIDTYDIRIAFWTHPDLFDNFLPVYEQIISTLIVTGGLL